MKAALRVERLINNSVFRRPSIQQLSEPNVELFIIRVNRLIDTFFVIYTSDALFYTLRGLLRN